MPRSSAWNQGVARGSSSAGATPRGPSSDDRGWVRHAVQRGRASLPDVPPESLLAKGGRDRHGASTGPRGAAGSDASLPGARKRAAASARVADVLAAIERFAPLALAAEWDNVGLLAGRPEAPARKALLAIDLTDAVAQEALRSGADLLLIYHPPIFKGIRSITAQAECPTALLPELLGASTSIVALHTALDAAVGGTNDLLLDAFATVTRTPLEPLWRDSAKYKLVVFVPADGAERLREGLAAAGAGVIGHYDHCSFESSGAGTFRGDETTNPAVGQRGQLERAAETRLEMVVPAGRLADAVRAVYANHAYEEPAFDIYPLRQPADRGRTGMGRVARLRQPTRGQRLLAQLAQRVDLANASVVGDLRRSFSAVAAAAGSFGVRSFRDPDCLYLTGEFKHHDALDLLKRGITAVHLGHYESERPLLAYVAAQLQRQVPGLKVRVARADRSPFTPVPASQGRA